MMKLPAPILGLLLCAALSACKEEKIASAPSSSNASATAPAEATATRTPSGQPQPKLATIKLWLGAQEIAAEQAVTETQIQTGMMFRRDIGEQEGMLFIFVGPMRASFWMRNTLIPLSCAYIDPEGVILEIREMKPLDETPIEAVTDRVQYVLEVKHGWFERNNVKAGMLVRTERGSLRETYFGK